MSPEEKITAEFARAIGDRLEWLRDHGEMTEQEAVAQVLTDLRLELMRRAKGD